jgi:putative ABC transport system ATP-binding protein
METSVKPLPRAVLHAEGLTKSYQEADRTLMVLDHLDLLVHAHETVTILGVSGTGKSTLLNILSGIDAPDSGRLVVDGLDVTAQTAAGLTTYRREKIGFVFQFYNLIPSLTAVENVMAGWEAVRRSAAEGKERAIAALERVGLARKLDRFPAQLSGGEQQRVAIARAVAKRPPLLLCDEPTGALDFRTGILVLDVIERINRELGTATAVITHNAPIAEIADRVVTLADGRIQSERLVTRRARPSDLRW